MRGIEVGGIVKIDVVYYLESDESNINITASTQLRIIETDFVLKFQTNKNNILSFGFNDTITINITGSYDPEDPGANLVFNWVCPTWV
jgi:hypothetical protein